ncbi:MAG TPA: hypothetical protein VFG38_06700 [Pseudomonadales bacterium]|nr:hypothetical protein [Pseudomonadales bacterium]
MKRWLIGIAGAIALVAIGGYVFREPLMNALIERVTANMYVSKDAYPFDPGRAVGERLPPLRALYRGREIADVGALMGAKGLALYVNRSVDW